MVSFLSNKYVLWVALILVIGAGIFGILQTRSCLTAQNNELSTYTRQLEGQLSNKERDLQAAHYDLGIAKSELVTSKELAKRLAQEKNELNDAFDAFVKEHNLQIASKDQTIAQLRQEIKNGTTTVVITPNDGKTDIELKGSDFTCSDFSNMCTVKYSWEDYYKRFRLSDPNVFVPNNETFTSNQLFKIYGEIWKQKNGSLQIKRLVLREVYQDANSDYVDIPNGKAEIINSEFVYTDEPSEPIKAKWYDIFKIRGVATINVVAFPNGPDTTLGLGISFLEYKGLTLGSTTNFNFTNIDRLSQNINVAYSPIINKTQLNVGLVTSVGTQWNKLFKSFVVSGGLIFFLTN